MARVSGVQLLQLLTRWPDRGANAEIALVALMLAESGGDTNAISSSHDYGLFQINRIHFGDGIINYNNWTQINVQLGEMWSLSAGMTNYAAWCTMWANPGRDCGHGHVLWPQPGSAAEGHLIAAQEAWVQFTQNSPTLPNQPPSPDLTPAETADYTYLQFYLARTFVTQLTHLNNARFAIDGVVK